MPLLYIIPAEAAADYPEFIRQKNAAKTLAQAFVGGLHDYCNSLLYGVSCELLRRTADLLRTRQHDIQSLVHRKHDRHHASAAQPSLLASD